ncbi:expressed unknown protein [Seminavis robusta]|uniref:Uncharacterized protein n=1 Tax=Seminavis robusta TaxID=568900 RepID=A0A9N8DJE2_9STRA|nr:expressed unknown protein [Seminavis robusta]|eukprot:Sro190_g081891.1  (119) ;mRNA; r:60522-60878
MASWLLPTSRRTKTSKESCAAQQKTRVLSGEREARKGSICFILSSFKGHQNVTMTLRITRAVNMMSAAHRSVQRGKTSATNVAKDEYAPHMVMVATVAVTGFVGGCKVGRYYVDQTEG